MEKVSIFCEFNTYRWLDETTSNQDMQKAQQAVTEDIFFKIK